MEYELSERDGAQSVYPGDTVIGVQYLTSCCLILVETTTGIMAQHWPGMGNDTLDERMFPSEEEKGTGDREVIAIFLVTASESHGQIAEATALHRRFPQADFTYYAYKDRLCPRPTVRVGEEGFELDRVGSYHSVNIP